MTRSPWLKPLAVLLVFITVFTGCVTASPRDAGDSASVAASSDGDAAQKTRGGHDGRAAFFVIATIFFVLVVIADVIILPCTIPTHRPFCCTHEVIVIWFH